MISQIDCLLYKHYLYDIYNSVLHAAYHHLYHVLQGARFCLLH